MTMQIGGEHVTRLTELRRNSKQLIEQIKTAQTQQDSRVILTSHGKPVAVLQEYEAYQSLVKQLDEVQKQLGLLLVKERFGKIQVGDMETVPLEALSLERDG